MGGRGGAVGGAVGHGGGAINDLCSRTTIKYQQVFIFVFRHNSVCNDYYSLFSLKKKHNKTTGANPRFVNRGYINVLSGNDLNKIRPYFFKTTHEDAASGLNEPRESPLHPPLKQ